MKFKIFLAGFLACLFWTQNSNAQTPEDIWNEYLFLKPSFSELKDKYPLFNEPYYSLALKEMKNESLNPNDLKWLLIQMMQRLPDDYDSLFREFWGRLSSFGTKDDLFALLSLTNNDISKLPITLNWFVDDVVSTLLRKGTDVYMDRDLACFGPNKYRSMFFEKFFDRNPSTNELVNGATTCQSNEKFAEVFIKNLLNHSDTTKTDLLNLLSSIEKFPLFHDHYFSLLMMYSNELDFGDLLFIEAVCKTEPYCSFFSRLKLSATVERRRELSQIMEKK